MLRTALISITAALAFATPAIATAPAPKVTAVSLETVTDGVPKGTVAIYFRTDRALPRESGGSLAATAGLKKATEGSVSTHRRSPRWYVAYTKAAALKLGSKAKVRIAIAGRVTTRTVVLEAESAAR